MGEREQREEGKVAVEKVQLWFWLHLAGSYIILLSHHQLKQFYQRPHFHRDYMQITT